MTTRKTESSNTNKKSSSASSSKSAPSAPKKKKYKSSRAGRCEEACDNIRDEASLFRSVADELEDRLELLKEEGDTLTIPGDLFADLSTDLSDLTSPLEELKDEMQSWYDNLPESLQSGDKGDRIQEAASNLEAAVDTLTNVEVPGLLGEGESAEMSRAKLEELRDSLNELADNLESGADEAEGTDFPGMYG